MRFIKFIPYYFGLRLQVLLGLRYTSHPLGVRWRWRHWQRISR
jgi:hypothetical protein